MDNKVTGNQSLISLVNTNEIRIKINTPELENDIIKLITGEDSVKKIPSVILFQIPTLIDKENLGFYKLLRIIATDFRKLSDADNLSKDSNKLPEVNHFCDITTTIIQKIQQSLESLSSANEAAKPNPELANTIKNAQKSFQGGHTQQLASEITTQDPSLNPDTVSRQLNDIATVQRCLQKVQDGTAQPFLTSQQEILIDGCLQLTTNIKTNLGCIRTMNSLDENQLKNLVGQIITDSESLLMSWRDQDFLRRANLEHKINNNDIIFFIASIREINNLYTLGIEDATITELKELLNQVIF